jgi:hypothetical protein
VTNIGAPQGDSLNPVLFIIYLELAMMEIALGRSTISTSQTKQYTPMTPTASVGLKRC